MLPGRGAKTESAPKARWVGLVTVVVLVGLLVVAGLLYARRGTDCLRVPSHSEVCIELERAVTDEQRQRGLSGRQGMPKDRGMLFIFESPGRHCFWMKDMHFDIDMIWLDADKRVAAIKERAPASSYPETFCPDTNAQYVIELNAGQAAELGLSKGKYVNVP